MRIILLFIIISLTNINCVEHNNSSKESGKWYSPYFGLVEISENSLIHYPNITPKETWSFDEFYDGYKYKGVLYKQCSMQSGEELIAKVELIDKEQLIIKSDDGCFLKHSFGQKILLNRVPDNIETSFSEVSFSRRIDGKWKEVVYTLEKLQSENKQRILTTNQQLWMIFNSGIDYNNACTDKSERDFMVIKLKGDNYISCKKVYYVIIPLYFKDLFHKINTQLIE